MHEVPVSIRILYSVQECSQTTAFGAQDEEGDDKQGFRRIERGFGKFVRRFQLPDNTDPEHIQVICPLLTFFLAQWLKPRLACA